MLVNAAGGGISGVPKPRITILTYVDRVFWGVAHSQNNQNLMPKSIVNMLVESVHIPNIETLCYVMLCYESAAICFNAM
jgi:hypothetical protein